MFPLHGMRPTLHATAELRYVRHEVGSAAMQRCCAGKFIAHSNLGLCYAALGEDAQALLNHRQAFRRGIDNRGCVMRAMPSGCTDAQSHARAHTHARRMSGACVRPMRVRRVDVLLHASAWDHSQPVRIRAPVWCGWIRYSVVMSSLPGESVSCGNLGVISAKKEDAATAKAKATRTAATVE
jgi:hypothetical protein